MRTHFASLLCRTGFVLTLVIFSQANAAEPSRGADMLRLLGFDVAVSGYADQIRNSPTGVEGQDSDFEKDRNELIDELFQPERLFSAVVDRVKWAFSEAEYDQLDTYFSKGVGLRVTEAEKQAQSEPQGDEQDVVRLIAIEDLLEKNPERLDQISQMIVSMDLVGSGSAMAMNIGYALISGMASTGQLPGDPSDERILGILNAQRGQIEERIFDTSVESLAYTYRNISDDELDDYIAFLDGDLGQKLYNVLNSALVEVLTTVTRKYGHDLMQRSGVREL